MGIACIYSGNNPANAHAAHNLNWRFYIMSISNRHTLVKLEKNSKPMAGQRLARVIAKAAKEALGADWVEKNNGFYNPNLLESMCVSIPHVEQAEIVENIDSLVPHIMGLIQDTQ